MRAALATLYLAAIVAANLSVAHFGPSAVVLVAFAFIGLDLTCRDQLHDRLGRHRVPALGALIAAGSALSYMVNADAGPIAVASCVAFAGAAVADSVVYHLRRRASWFERANESNLAGAAVDSILFPALAFPGPLAWAIVLGQFTAKVAGGFVWSLVLRGRKPRRSGSTVYLAGPHMDDAFRQAVSPLLVERGLEPFDPIAARDFRGIEIENEDVIVEGDLADVDRCRVILGNFTVPGWGTGMETWHGFRSGCPIVAYVEPDARVSPWVAYVAGGYANVHRDLVAACDAAHALAR